MVFRPFSPNPKADGGKPDENPSSLARNKYTVSSPGYPDAGTVIDLDFTVDAQGRASEIKLLANSGPRKLSRYVIATLESARYRPKLINGKPVPTPHVHLRQAFVNNEPAAPSDSAPNTLRVSTMVACGSWQTVAGRF